ncbi:MAG: TIGR02996 domain-containing protein [Fimbriiglobus sp.]|nr:TIGR02996 domain-containing protein [Fimbriiglobus sp.]
MSTESALLAAIAAAPDDDLPRLVYADWLDENGQPLRAEFIRLQIEIAKKETLPRAAVNAFSHLWQRQQEILDHHRDELLGPLAGVIGCHESEFRRGFLNDITLSAELYNIHGEAIAGLVPLPERVEVIYAADKYSIFHQPIHCLNAVTHLRMSSRHDDISDLTDLGDIPLIRDACGWLRLQSLDLESCQYGDDSIASLFATPCFPALQDLDLSFNDLTDAGVIALLNTGVPQRLKRLVLGGNPIGDQAAMELADRLGNSKVLESLNLRMTNIGSAGQAALLARLGAKVDLF